MDNYGPKAIVCVEDPRKEELQEELEEIVQENDVGQADLGSEIWPEDSSGVKPYKYQVSREGQVFNVQGSQNIAEEVLEEERGDEMPGDGKGFLYWSSNILERISRYVGRGHGGEMGNWYMTANNLDAPIKQLKIIWIRKLR